MKRLIQFAWVVVVVVLLKHLLSKRLSEFQCEYTYDWQMVISLEQIVFTRLELNPEKMSPYSFSYAFTTSYSGEDSLV